MTAFGAADPPATPSSTLAIYLTLPRESTPVVSFIPSTRIYLCPRKHSLSAIHPSETPLLCHLPSRYGFQCLSKLFDASMRIYCLYLPSSRPQNLAVPMQTPPSPSNSSPGHSPFGAASPLLFPQLSKLFDASMRTCCHYLPSFRPQNLAVPLQISPFAIHSSGTLPPKFGPPTYPAP